MRYTHNINASKCLEWGLNLNQGALVDIINQSASWATPCVVKGVTYYWVSRNKIVNEIPVAYSKPDTVYRALRTLSEKGIIEHIKDGKKDLVRLTEKGKSWNVVGTPQGDSKLGNKSESEINPNKLGNKSENNSEEYPTYNNTSNSPNTNNPNTIVSEKSEADIKESGTTKKPKPAAKPTKYKPVKPDEVSEQTWNDLLALRKAKKGVDSETAWKTINNALEKTQQVTGHSLEQIIIEWVTAEWKSFKFDWYMNRTKATNQLTVNNQVNNYGQQQPKQQSAAQKFDDMLDQQLAAAGQRNERTVN